MNKDSGPPLGKLRKAILCVFPELEHATFRPLPPGWDSYALEADGQLVFKFPRSGIAEKALRKEASLLEIIRPAVTMPVPDMTLHEGPPLFSSHDKLRGEHLVTAQYERLPERARDRLAQDMALFYAELHALDVGAMQQAGAEPDLWQPPEAIIAEALPLLPEELRSRAARAVELWQDLPPDQHGTIYGFFDGHGWNMAFDHERQQLNGIYDFADSGLGPLHQEFIYSTFISPDLTERIVARYEQLTGRMLDRKRIALLTGIHRLSELAELAHEPKHHPDMIGHVASWAAIWRG